MGSLLRLGSHVEMLKVGKKLDDPDAIANKLVSSIHEIPSDNQIIITNPTMKARLIPMHIGERYEFYFWANQKIYYARGSIAKNSTDGKMRVVTVNLTSSLEKYDRRQFFRFDAALDCRYLLITAENSAEFKKAVLANKLLGMQGFKKGTTVDISGGGLKFTSSEELPIDGLIVLHMIANKESGDKNYVFLSKVLASKKHELVKELFEHRAMFVNLNNDATEEFVQFIFECQRERLKKING